LGAAPHGGRRGGATLAALQLGAGSGSGEAAPVPEGIATVRHKKEKGTGYVKGSPLYERQQAIAVAAKESAAEAAKVKQVERERAAVKKETAAPEKFQVRFIESPGFFLWFMFVIVGCAGIAAAIHLGSGQQAKGESGRPGGFPERQPLTVHAAPPRPASPQVSQAHRRSASGGSPGSAGSGGTGAIHPALVPGPQPAPSATLMPPAVMDFAPVLPPTAGSQGGFPAGGSPAGSFARLGPPGPGGQSPPASATMVPGPPPLQSSSPTMLQPGSGVYMAGAPAAQATSPHSRGASPIHSGSFQGSPHSAGFGQLGSR